MAGSQDGDHGERSPLLQQNGHAPDPDRHNAEDDQDFEIVDFEKEDVDNPRNWSRRRKLANVGIIALMAVLSPLASSMFTPGISQIADDLKCSPGTVVGATTGFVIFLGIGPLILAPLSETFGRRQLYIVCFGIFTLTQIPTALSPNIEFLITMRALSGFFGSIGIANGGGTISDMFDPSQRASIFGWYLLGPLLGPTLGPLFGGFIVQGLGWRWLFWILTIVCVINTLAGYFFLRETYAPVLLAWRKKEYEEASNHTKNYRIANQDLRPLRSRILSNLKRPVQLLFTQPIVFTMALYQAILFGTVYSLWTNFEAIYGQGYGFSTTEVGLTYLGPGVGFFIAVWFLVPRIDTVYNRLTVRTGGESKPEYRLPLANIGAVLIPISLFWYAWTVEFKVHWFVTVLATLFFGLGQVMILNTVQNYYIDSFSKYAASAIAAGTVFRSIVGGIMPLIATPLFAGVGYGWGISVFGFLSLALAPAPILFMKFGGKLREKYAIKW